MSDLNAKKPPVRSQRRGKGIAKPSTRLQRRLFLESLEGRSLLATITIDPTFIRTVQDTAPINGTFDSFVGSSQFLRIGRSPTLNEERGIMEFDTSPIAGAIINSATLSLWHNGITLPDFTANIAVNAFAGNGVADVSDAQANNLQGSASFSLATLGVTKFVDVKSFLQQNSNGSTNFAGFNLRDTTLQATQATIEIAQGGLGTELPQLTVNYTPVDSLITVDASGNLIITDHASNADNYTIKRAGGNYTVTNPGVVMGTVIPGSSGSGTATITIPAAAFVGGIFFNGGGGNDTLTVDLSGGNFTPSITYNGGTQSGPPGDKLVVTGGAFANGTLNHTNATDGSVVLGTNTINYTGLEPVDVTGSSITDLVINLPDDAVTGDDTELSVAAGNLVVTSLNGTHELDAIALAGFTTVTINARAGDDKVTLDSTMSTFNKVLTLNGGAGADKFVFETSIVAPGTIAVNGGAGIDTLDYSAFKVAAVETAVNVGLSATAANGFSGDVKIGGATITSFTEIDSVTGNSTVAGDTLTGLNAAAAWTIDEGTTSKYVSTGTLTFAKFDRLAGGSNSDAFTITNSGAVPFNLAGGAGSNSLNLSAVVGGAVTLTNVDAAGADGKETTKNITFSDVKTLTGDGTGSLTGTNAAATWVIDDAATNTYATDLAFAGIKILTGGDDVDTFNVLNNSGAIAYSLKGGKGLDAFNFGVANSLANISQAITVDGETDSATLTLNDQAVATPQNYTAGASTIGRDTGGTVTYAAITDLTLNASNGANTIKVTAVPAATGVKTFNGGTGDDALDLSGIAANVVITAPNATKGFDGDVTGVASFTGIESFKGNGASTFQGDDEVSTWTINDATTSNYASQSRTAIINGFNTLQGGSKVDTFNVENNSGATAYTLKGGAGLDAFNFGSANSLAGITNNIIVDGENDAATLTLNDQGVATAQNYTVTANSIGRDTGGKVTYATITDVTLNASNGANTIKITAIPAATGVKTFNGGTGDDTLDTTSVAVNAIVNAPNATKGFDGTISAAGNFTAIEIFKGNNASTFQGDDEVATWTINDTTGNTYVSQSRTANISGYNVMQGGSKVDTFNVQDNSGALAYTLNGGAGVDIFNFGLANSLAAISKNIAVNGEAESATLTLNDQAVATNINYTLGANTIGRDTGGTVTYSTITDLTLNASNGANTIKVTAVPTATGVKTLNGGTGDDSLDLTALAVTDVTLTAANVTKGFDGNIAGVAKFTGVEEIKGNGTGDLSGINEDATWTINTATGNTYVSQSKTLKFSGFDNLNGGSKVDTYKVQDNSAPAPTYTLNGNAGGDKFLIGDTANKLVNIKSLNVIGGADTGDELTLNDQAEPGASDYTITGTTAVKNGGVVVTHSTVEKITLNASQGANAIKVFDDAYNPSTTIKLVDTTGASTLDVDDSGDTGTNTWTITNASVTRTAPTPTLTIDYSAQATITSLNFAGGMNSDTVNVNSTKVATSVVGNEANDVFNVGNGDLDNFAGQLTVVGGDTDDPATRTVVKGGGMTGGGLIFSPGSSAEVKGDTLNVNDSQQTGLTKYAVTSSNVSRTGAAKSVTYSKVEFLSVQAGKDESDIVISLPTAPNKLPAVVSIDGGNAAKDNRVKIVGTDADESITIGNATGVETDRSQFEVTSVTRLWVEGGKGADIIHNRSSVPGLLDGGYAKSTAALDAGNQDDIIASDAQSTTAFSPVLLGNDGKDIMYTTNSSASGTTYLVGDYFVNNNVALTAGSATKTSRLQVVAGPGQAGDRYITNHTPISNLRNRVLARIDTAADSYSGRFANLTADTIGSTLGVIEWLRGRLPLTVSASGMASELAKINYQIRLFVRDPGSAAAPAFPNATYNPGGVASGGSFNGGEAIGDDATEPTPLVQNPFDAGDVNGDGRISAFDALLIINELNRSGAHQLDTSAGGEYGVNGNTPLNFLDVNGDSSVSAFDAILIINRLNTSGTTSYVPDSFQWFVDADNAEQAAADWANQLPQQSLPVNSWSDEALLALLAANDAASDES